jgi:predicted RNA binding protein YcfA (HicA-like mRNA interferase family)
MGQKLKLISGEEAVRKFVRDGWTVARRSGSHIMLTKTGCQWTLSVPNHPELGRGLLRKLIRQAALTPEQFNTLQWFVYALAKLV